MIINILISISILRQQTYLSYFFKESCNSLEYIYNEKELLGTLNSLRMFNKINSKRSKKSHYLTNSLESDFIMEKNLVKDIDSYNRRSKKFYEPNILINNLTKCVKDEKTILIMCLIHSHKNNFLRRKAMRDTWLTMNNVYLEELMENNLLNYQKIEIKHAFLIGNDNKNETYFNIKSEADAYGDIIMIDTIDNYKNLLYKHLTVVNWVIKHCHNAHFIIKLDDDVFVNIKALGRHLIEKFGITQKNSKFMYCNINEMAMPIRENVSKWYVNSNTYPFSLYPKYCEGFAYITNVPTMRLMYEQSKIIPRFWIDDVYFTGLLLYGINEVKWYDFKNFLKWSYYDFWDLGNTFKIYEIYAKILKFFKINAIDYYLSDFFVVLHSQLDNKEVNYNLVSLESSLLNPTEYQNFDSINLNSSCLSHINTNILNVNCTSSVLSDTNDNKTFLYVNFYNFCINLWKKNNS
ncbi:unnamed protein product [Brachionus calyciflorus]|uniref:Hexosyltransferase n=1 Tax=Brachionus calyciflorus TaxID=104777 RepID=A0A813V0E2_9BILA|nr:unnamed protein product [Brachionus calyciflorus]